jgi:hypothetical protein
MNSWNRFRQLLFPPEFRIADGAWTESEISQLEQLAALTKGLATAAPRDDSRLQQKRQTFLAEVGTGLWRLRQKMTQPGGDRPLEEMRRAFRHLESVWDTLEKDGIKIYDHTGEDFDAGKSLRVLAYQPTDGLRRERVLETIKPTVYAGDDLIQMGEVIVGTPEAKS